MTQIEDRLRAALASAPTPVTSTPDPLDDLSRRVGRARRQLAAAAVIAVAVLVAAIVIPLALLGSATGRNVPAHQTHVRSVPFAPWPAGSVGQLAAGGGSIWTLRTTQRPSHQPQTVLQRRDPRTGRVDATYPVRHATGGQISYGLGKVWVWAYGDGGAGGGIFLDQLTVLNPQTGQVVSSPLGGERPNNSHPYDFYTASALAVAGTTMVGVQTDQVPDQSAAPVNNNRVRGFVANNRFAASVGGRSVLGAESLLSGDGALLFLGEKGVVAQYPASAGWPQSGPSEPVRLTGFPLTAAAQGFWAVRGDRLLHEDLTGRLISPSVKLPLEHIAPFRNGLPPVQATVDTAGGLYVTVAYSSRAGTLFYYSPAALRAAQPTPSALHFGPEFTQIVADPAGGVVVAANGGNRLGSQHRWDPATR